MDSYLEIAHSVLRDARRPLTPRQILSTAYANDIVPDGLYGRTQHKTLQARLSEDILKKKEDSAFFRTRPGRFFLREFLWDPSIPEEFRTPISARRRTRDLVRGPALALRSESAATLLMQRYEEIREDAGSAFHFTYLDPRVSPDGIFIWAAAVVMRDDMVLCYRAGRYREDRDTFTLKRSISFNSLVTEEDRSLFDVEALGIQSSALKAVVADLDIPVGPSHQPESSLSYSLRRFVRGDDPAFRNAILALVIIQCPTWFEPTTRRLSLNDLHWLPLKNKVNDLDDFDPWSRTLWHQLGKMADH